MMTEIDTDKGYALDDVKGRVLRDIRNCIMYDDLPKEYLQGYPRYSGALLGCQPMCIIRDVDFAISLVPGRFISEDEFQKCIEIMKRAGDRLFVINKKNDWSGSETVKI